MSLQKWREKYYPWDLHDPNITPSIAIQRCLSKWEGLAHLDEFHLVAYSHCIKERGYSSWVSFPANHVSCGLCHLYYTPSELFIAHSSCEKCLFTTLLGHACDEPLNDGTRSEWWYWVEKKNPYFMVDALLRIYDLYKED